MIFAEHSSPTGQRVFTQPARFLRLTQVVQTAD
jgi:hypothetical protein